MDGNSRRAFYAAAVITGLALFWSVYLDFWDVPFVGMCVASLLVAAGAGSLLDLARKK
jgi:hypothetical protein